MKIIVLFALAVLVASFPEPQSPKPQTVFNLTELQKARLDAARQEVFRWQDKTNEALIKFGAICEEATKENKWPAVQCSLTDLTVTAVPAPAPVITAVPASPPVKEK
jgi:hypothetical protein